MTVTNSSQLAGSISWTPDFTQANVYFFNVSAADADSVSATAFKVTVADVPPQVAVTSPLVLGGDTQDRSDPNHDTTERREVNVTGTINVQNSGSEQLNDLKVVSITFASGFSASDLLINYTLPKTTLAPGETMAVPLTVRVPQRLDAVDNSLNRISPLVATLNFAATPAVSSGTVTAGSQIYERAQNNLKIKTVKVSHGDKSETVKDGDKVEKLKAGEAVSFEIEVENRFKDKQDVKMEDITVRVVSDSELDIDEDETISSLSADDKDTVKLDAIMDDTADDGTFDVDISADGTDEFGARHGEKIRIRFEVKRKSHEISIESISLNPQTVSCEKVSNLRVGLKNTGRRDEDEVYVHVEAAELNYGRVSDKLSLDKDDETSMNFNIAVPQTVKPGSYHVNVETYYNTGTSSNTDAATLTVAACNPAAEEAPVMEQPKPVQPPVTVITVPEQPKANATTLPPAPAKKSFLETPQYVALLVLGYVVVLGGGAALLLKLARR